MALIKFETSERGDTLNWVKKEIINGGFGLLSFEGYTVKSNLVSGLFDRGLFENDIHSIDPKEIYSFLANDADFNLKGKLDFSKRLSVPYYFFSYSYLNQYCVVFKLTETIELVAEFNSYVDFGNWTKQFRDLVMLSQYEESGLPQLDKILRASGIAWPGNLDYALTKSGTPIALIEFQRTAKASVQQHCNNTWFLPTPYRKGDVNRWLAIDIIRKQSKLPLYIIVWSTQEKIIKLKLLDHIVYPEDSSTTKGLVYSKKEVMEIQRMIEIFNKL